MLVPGYAVLTCPPACMHVQAQSRARPAAYCLWRRQRSPVSTAVRGDPPGAVTPAAAAAATATCAFDPSSWQSEASSILAQLGLPGCTSPQQLWQRLSAQEAPSLQLDLPSCRLLLSAAAATCSTQQQHNQLRPLFQAAPRVFPSFELQDFRQLLQLCAQARFIPDKEWLASIYYSDTGGFERFYQEVSWSVAPPVLHSVASPPSATH